MEVKEDELGPPIPVSDEQLLLAIGRARDHSPPGDKTRIRERGLLAAHHEGLATG